MTENNKKNYICDICENEYSNRQNLWRHIKTKHKNNDENTTILPQNTTKIINSTTILPQNTTILKTIENSSIKQDENGLTCQYCLKQLSRYDSFKRHLFICKKKKEYDENNNENKIKELQENQIHIKNILTELINKNCKIHPKKLDKINKQLNGNINTLNDITNNINNSHNTINSNNNTINIILPLGKENLTDAFTTNEKLQVLKNRYTSLLYLIEYTHFNDKYPQFKNILITNIQNNLAYTFDDKLNKFIAVDKNELLENIIDARMFDIQSFYEELEDNIDERTKDVINKIKDKIDNDPEYKKLKKKEIKLFIFNNKDKISTPLTIENS